MEKVLCMLFFHQTLQNSKKLLNKKEEICTYGFAVIFFHIQTALFATIFFFLLKAMT
jgi:hypothetical protein